MAWPKKIFLILVCLFLAGLAAAGGYLWYENYKWEKFLATAPDNPGHEITVRVKPGSTFLQVRKTLAQNGLITSPEFFLRLAREKQLTAKVRAGEFVLNTGWKPEKILDQLTGTSGVLIRLSVREGLAWWQVGQLVQKAGLGSFQSFEQAVFNSTLLKQYHIPAKNAEGYLFPETYLLTRPLHDNAQNAVRAMLAQFEKQVKILWPGNPPKPEELNRVITLASLVEKETGDTTERDRIAGVFGNRLEKRMLLQADPTTIYGLGPDFDGNLRKSHLQDKSNPYNTYRHLGLPPGPICSPGLSAIRAAMTPEKHKYLYFVAKGDGSHYFSKNLKEHNKAVAKYQLRRNRETYRSYHQEKPASDKTN